MATPDATNTPKLTKMAICPKGANPTTKRHDVDYFRIDVGAGVATVMAELFYDITYGDLDVAVLDAGGTMLGSDGTAVTNALRDRRGGDAGHLLRRRRRRQRPRRQPLRPARHHVHQDHQLPDCWRHGRALRAT